MIFSKVILKNELRRHLPLTLAWGIGFGIVGFSMFGLFDTLKAQSDQLNALLSSFPSELISAFGADASSLATVIGYYNARFLSLVLLVNGVLAVYLGASTLGQEIANNQILFLATKPIARWKIYLSKFSALTILLGIMNVVICLLSILGVRLLTQESDIPLGYFVTVTTAAWIFQLVYLSLGMLIGVIFTNGQSIIIGLGLSLGGFIIDGMSKLKGAPEFLKYITPYYYFDLRYLGENWAVKQPEFWMLPGVIIVMVVIGIMWFRRRDLV